MGDGAITDGDEGRAYLGSSRANNNFGGIFSFSNGSFTASSDFLLSSAVICGYFSLAGIGTKP